LAVDEEDDTGIIPYEAYADLEQLVEKGTLTELALLATVSACALCCAVLKGISEEEDVQETADCASAVLYRPEHRTRRAAVRISLLICHRGHRYMCRSRYRSRHK
jgi:hypothetical protein